MAQKPQIGALFANKSRDNLYFISFIDGKINEYYQVCVGPNEAVLILQPMPLTGANIVKDEWIVDYDGFNPVFHTEDGDAARLATHEINGFRKKAAEEYKTTGQIKGYLCFFANKFMWISQYDLKTLKEVKNHEEK